MNKRFIFEGVARAIVEVWSSMQQIVAAKHTITAGMHLRRTLLVANPSRAGTIIQEDLITTYNAMIRWARVTTALVYAIKPLWSASIAIGILATIRTLTIGKVSVPKRPRHLKMILRGVHLCGMIEKNIQKVV